MKNDRPKSVIWSYLNVQTSLPMPFDPIPYESRTVEGTPLMIVARQNQSSRPKSSLAHSLYPKRWMTKMPEIMPSVSVTVVYSAFLS